MTERLSWLEGMWQSIRRLWSRSRLGSLSSSRVTNLDERGEVGREVGRRVGRGSRGEVGREVGEEVGEEVGG